jgi:ABC-type spermidine/putrescine transport system permease subunit I
MNFAWGCTGLQSFYLGFLCNWDHRYMLTHELIIWDGVSLTFCLGLLWTVTLLISTFCVDGFRCESPFPTPRVFTNWQISLNSWTHHSIVVKSLDSGAITVCGISTIPSAFHVQLLSQRCSRNHYMRIMKSLASFLRHRKHSIHVLLFMSL